ncbi:MAG: MjaI family restriction endonuclease [Bacteroidota bacterium]
MISAEVEEITEQDCIDYRLQLVIDRNFDGYWTEIKSFYGQPEQEPQLKLKQQKRTNLNSTRQERYLNLIQQTKQCYYFKAVAKLNLQKKKKNENNSHYCT